MQTIRILLLLLIPSLTHAQAAPSITDRQDVVVRLCDKITVLAPVKVDFTDAEVGLVCGDSNNKAWEDIPLRQAEYFMKNFLEQQGFLSPEFVYKDKMIEVHTGARSLVSSIELLESPVSIDIEEFWQPIGRPLTPSRLDNIEKWIVAVLARRGYPCAKLETRAERDSGIVAVKIASGEKWHFKSIRSTGLAGFLGGVERRYDAFDIGDTYDAQLLDLTSRRLIANDLVLNNSFVPQCSGEVGHVVQTILPGQPRLVTFGFGFDTEEYLLTRASWLNGRLFESASRMEAQAQASFRRQLLKWDFEWYYLPFASRHYLDAYVTVRRKNERRFETQEFIAGVAPAWQFDWRGSHHGVQSGPGYRMVRTPRGLAKPMVRIVSWDSRWRLMTNNYEYYMGSPQSGHQVEFIHSKSEKGALSDISSDQYKLTSTHLANLPTLDPPIFIFGLRSEVATTYTHDDTAPEDLPPFFRYHLGGTANLRGFGRNALPNSDLGALTVAYVGGELRLNEVIPHDLQPFVFTDHGWLGEKAFAVKQHTMYWSPGMGMRWESPFGSMRASLGHGLVKGEGAEDLAYLSRWQFYFSFGEPF